MDVKKFRDTESRYNELKARLESGETSPDDLKAQLKKMMVMDETGQYWMIGSKTGKWYRYDGTEWKPGDPYPASVTQPAPGAVQAAAADRRDESPAEVVIEEPPAGARTDRMPGVHGDYSISLQEHAAAEKEEPGARAPAAAPHPEAPAASPAGRPVERHPAPRQNATVAERPDTSTICRFCKSKIDAHAHFCPFCGGSQTEPVRSRGPERHLTELQVRGVHVVSLMLFLGVVGLVIGVVFGALFGVFPILGDLIYQFPLMLQEARGKLMGGVLFGLLGGAGGFACLAGVGLLLGLFFNFICFITWGRGIRFRVRT